MMIKNKIKLGATLPLVALAAALGACSPADKTDSNTTVQTEPVHESASDDNAADVAREMHNRMNEDQAMHDSMKGGAMADDHMDKIGQGGMNDPAMKGGAMKGMGDKPATDPAPKDKPDPMPMTDM